MVGQNISKGVVCMVLSSLLEFHLSNPHNKALY